jgi:hypothetical protein
MSATEQAIARVSEAVDQDWYDGRMNLYRLQWLQVMTYRFTRFVLYGHGQWDGHIMDWRGCNFFHGRVPGTPLFTTAEEAVMFAEALAKARVIAEHMTLSGHHSGDLSCSKGCDDREVVTVHLNGPKHNEERLRKPGVYVYKREAENAGLALPKRLLYG